MVAHIFTLYTHSGTMTTTTTLYSTPSNTGGWVLSMWLILFYVYATSAQMRMLCALSVLFIYFTYTHKHTLCTVVGIVPVDDVDGGGGGRYINGQVCKYSVTLPVGGDDEDDDGDGAQIGWVCTNDTTLCKPLFSCWPPPTSDSLYHHLCCCCWVLRKRCQPG